jgi:hypothetical protein
VPIREAGELLACCSGESWDFQSDSNVEIHWYQGVTSCEDTSPTKGVVGATRRMVSGLQADEEFIALEPMRVRGFTIRDQHDIVKSK